MPPPRPADNDDSGSEDEQEQTQWAEPRARRVRFGTRPEVVLPGRRLRLVQEEPRLVDAALAEVGELHDPDDACGHQACGRKPEARATQSLDVYQRKGDKQETGRRVERRMRRDRARQVDE